jgi:hypothetical protein
LIRRHRQLSVSAPSLLPFSDIEAFNSLHYAFARPAISIPLPTFQRFSSLHFIDISFSIFTFHAAADYCHIFQADSLIRFRRRHYFQLSAIDSIAADFYHFIADYLLTIAFGCAARLSPADIFFEIIVISCFIHTLRHCASFLSP